jgi:hypothetical protein
MLERDIPEEHKEYYSSNGGYQRAVVRISSFNSPYANKQHVDRVKLEEIPNCGVRIGTNPTSCGFRLLWNVSSLKNVQGLGSLVFLSKYPRPGIPKGFLVEGVGDVLVGWDASGTLSSYTRLEPQWTYAFSSFSHVVDQIVALIEKYNLGEVTTTPAGVNPNTSNVIKGVFWRWNGNIIPYSEFAGPDYPYNENGTKK